MAPTERIYVAAAASAIAKSNTFHSLRPQRHFLRSRIFTSHQTHRERGRKTDGTSFITSLQIELRNVRQRKQTEQNQRLHFRHFGRTHGRRASGHFKLIKWVETSNGISHPIVWHRLRIAVRLDLLAKARLYNYLYGLWAEHFHIFLKFLLVAPNAIWHFRADVQHCFRRAHSISFAAFPLQLVSLLRIYTKSISYILMNVDQCLEHFFSFTFDNLVSFCRIRRDVCFVDSHSRKFTYTMYSLSQLRREHAIRK